MAYPPGPWLRVVCHFKSNEKRWTNTFWYVPNEPIPPALDIQAFAANVNSSFKPALVAFMASDTKYMGLQIYLNNGTTTISAQNWDDADGEDSSTTLPIEDSVIVRLQTGVGGRSGRGRHFFSGIPEAEVDGSYATPNLVLNFADVKTLCQTVHTWSGPGWVPQLYQQKESTLAPVSFATVERILGSQRRRRPVW